MKKNDRILTLLKATEAMVRGDYTVDIPTGNDEIGQLGKSLERLSSYLQKQSERNQSLYRIMVECNLNLQLNEVLNHIYESFQDHLPYDRISLALFENDGSKLKLHWSRSEHEARKLNVGYSISINNNALQAILILGSSEVMLIDDLETLFTKHPKSNLLQTIITEGIRSCLICPLFIEGKSIGLICFSTQKKNKYQQSHTELSLQIASQLAIIIEKSQLYKGIKLNKQLIEQKKSLEQRVTHDALTGLYNRPAILDILHKQISRAKRGGYDIAVIMIDIDHFKSINDSCGHLIGDAVLSEIASRLIQSARTHEYLGRYGGEEFLAIVSPYEQTGAVKAAERFRQAIASKEINADQTIIPVTISLGVAISTGKDTLDDFQLLKRADEALYTAKHLGRNRVELASNL